MSMYMYQYLYIWQYMYMYMFPSTSACFCFLSGFWHASLVEKPTEGDFVRRVRLRDSRSGEWVQHIEFLQLVSCYYTCILCVAQSPSTSRTSRRTTWRAKREERSDSTASCATSTSTGRFRTRRTCAARLTRRRSSSRKSTDVYRHFRNWFACIDAP